MEAPTSRRLDMALPADWICAKTMKAMTTVHQRVRQRHGAVQEKERRRAHDEHGKEVQAQALRDVVGREQLFNGQVALAVVFKRLPQPPVALAREIEGLDDAHALQLLQHCVHQLRLGFLSARRNGGGALFHRRSNGEIEERTGERQQTHSPVKGKDAEHKHHGVDKAAEDIYQNHRPPQSPPRPARWWSRR